MSELTWAEFKRIVEKKGIKDTDIIKYIDIWNGTTEDSINVEPVYGKSDKSSGWGISDK
jgi:hypothetical protein